MNSLLLMTDKKRANFARIVPKRVEKLRDMLRILGNCSNKANYSWNPEHSRKLFALLFLEFIATAKLFGINVTATIDGKDVDTWQG